MKKFTLYSTYLSVGMYIAFSLMDFFGSSEKPIHENEVIAQEKEDILESSKLQDELESVEEVLDYYK